jgi:hypothetical protein
MGRHRSSFDESRRARVRTILQDSSVSFAEAGRRLGVTRERIRQMAESLGIAEGRKRQNEERGNKAQRILGRIPGVSALRELGLEVEPANAIHSNRVAYTSSRQFCVNGRRCVTRPVWSTESARRNYGPDYAVIAAFHGERRINRDVEFVLYRLPDGFPSAGWLVIPAKETRNYNLAVKLGPPKDRPQARAAYEGKWMKYLNAWDQLKEAPPLETPSTIIPSEAAS